MADRPVFALARAVWAGIVVLMALPALHTAAAQAGEPILAEGAWARATPPGQDTAAVYLTIENIGRQGDVLLGAESPAARGASLHATVQNSGILSIRALESVTIPPGATVAFAPGGRHVMLTGLHAPLKAGAAVTLTLNFLKAGPVSASVTVVGPRDEAPAPVAGARASHFAKLGHQMLLEERDAGIVANLETIPPVEGTAYEAAMRNTEAPLPLDAIVEWNRRHLRTEP